jgi:leucyl aminopeptidase
LELGIKKNIIFACGFAENAIGSAVFKPGDIIKAMNGLSVEIGNTDAEGRLVLGDTMTYV